MRLSTDNRDQLPITDAVYGRPPETKKKDEKKRGPVARKLNQAIPISLLDHLADSFGGELKRLAAARHQKEDAWENS